MLIKGSKRMHFSCYIVIAITYVILAVTSYAEDDHAASSTASGPSQEGIKVREHDHT